MALRRQSGCPLVWSSFRAPAASVVRSRRRLRRRRSPLRLSSGSSNSTRRVRANWVVQRRAAAAAAAAGSLSRCVRRPPLPPRYRRRCYARQASSRSPLRRPARRTRSRLSAAQRLYGRAIPLCPCLSRPRRASSPRPPQVLPIPHATTSRALTDTRAASERTRRLSVRRFEEKVVVVFFSRLPNFEFF